MEAGLVSKRLKTTLDIFTSLNKVPQSLEDDFEKYILSIKGKSEYGSIKQKIDEKQVNGRQFESKFDLLVEKEKVEKANPNKKDNNLQLEIVKNQLEPVIFDNFKKPLSELKLSSGVSIVPRRQVQKPKPQYHPSWKLMRVISGHTGWVRCLAIDPSNEWFATGSNDRIIKIWDLASGKLRLSLTGHISSVRGLEISNRHGYLFSCGEDKTVKCWDLEYNKVIRHYHGHLSGVYSLSLHPTEDVLLTGGRDTHARLWDMRTKVQIHCLSGHTNTISSVKCQSNEPQIMTGSHDTTIRCWDIRAGKTINTLTNHKKGIRCLEMHPNNEMFVSGATDNIKQWNCEDLSFVQNLEGHNTIVNCIAINSDDVMVSGGDNGSLYFWDWKTGYTFQKSQVAPQSGSIDSEAGIFEMKFDMSGTRLITAEADKTIKVYKEDDSLIDN
ncbi:hypothetical protein RND71_043957 [Anisodus tanguticus]|uniref:Pleiotropic regulator 1 n=1 Tax=Anisodus tanguticus TaxID=243964 RepID=A0AAE1QQ47_9SOLA|nr:hypothetical protein RND71_043957 [Anisodus tanguticus]